jgi:hypothetical protein
MEPKFGYVTIHKPFMDFTSIVSLNQFLCLWSIFLSQQKKKWEILVEFSFPMYKFEPFFFPFPNKQICQIFNITKLRENK